MADRNIWQAPALFTHVPEHVQVTCSATHTCRSVLRVSVEDAAEGTVPQVEGWRTQVREGRLFAYCGECAEDHLPPEGPVV